MSPAIFVSFEGLDGAGKTTQIKLLAKYLKDLGRNVLILREPGGTDLGEQIRMALLHSGEVVPWAEASLFAAARAQLVELQIRPALAAGTDVICDRYIDSSLAYQGWGRELDVRLIDQWNRTVTGELVPDKTFFLALPAEDISPRSDYQLTLFSQGSTKVDKQFRATDRLERESIVFRRRIEEGYRAIARNESGRIVTLDARHKRPVIARSIQRETIALLEKRQQLDESVREILLRGR